MTMSDVEKIMLVVQEEFLEATYKNGVFNGGHEGYAVIKEELDELWEEVRHNNTAKACREAVQVAAMAIRFIYDLAHNLNNLRENK